MQPCLPYTKSLLTFRFADYVVSCLTIVPLPRILPNSLLFFIIQNLLSLKFAAKVHLCCFFLAFRLFPFTVCAVLTVYLLTKSNACHKRFFEPTTIWKTITALHTLSC